MLNMIKVIRLFKTIRPGFEVKSDMQKLPGLLSSGWKD